MPWTLDTFHALPIRAEERRRHARLCFEGATRREASADQGASAHPHPQALGYQGRNGSARLSQAASQVHVGNCGRLPRPVLARALRRRTVGRVYSEAAEASSPPGYRCATTSKGLRRHHSRVVQTMQKAMPTDFGESYVGQMVRIKHVTGWSRATLMTYLPSKSKHTFEVHYEGEPRVSAPQ